MMWKRKRDSRELQMMNPKMELYKEVPVYGGNDNTNSGVQKVTPEVTYCLVMWTK
jgi:hypothetical protein